MKIIIYKHTIIIINILTWYIIPYIVTNDLMSSYDYKDEIEIDRQDGEARGVHWHYDFGDYIKRPRYYAEIKKIYWLCFCIEYKYYKLSAWGEMFPSGFSSLQNKAA